MDERVRVRRVLPLAVGGGAFRFRVEIECLAKPAQVIVAAHELLDFDRFQTAVLEQTGRLVMAPCDPGFEGPEHYRRHRRTWCNELQAAVWDSPQPAAGPNAGPSGSAVPRPKSREFKNESTYRHG